MRGISKKVVASIAFCLSMAAALRAGNKTSQTFFAPRQLSNDAGFELALGNYQLYHNNHDEKDYERPSDRAALSFQNNYFYNESDSEADLAKYFLLGGKTSLRVNGGAGGLPFDIASDHIFLSTGSGDFGATFKIRPKRAAYGSALKVHFDMSKLLRGLWVSAFAPIMYAEHDTNFEETVTSTNAGEDTVDGKVLATVHDAFNASNWGFGKISTVKRSMTGVDNVQMQLGWNFFRGERFHWGFYGDWIIPTGARSSAEYIFEPMVGGVHWAIGAGTNLDLQVFKHNKFRVNLSTDFKWRYYFEDVEKRSFDLTNGEWSRYLSVVKSTATGTALPGINFFTRDMNVEPRSAIDWFVALHGKHSCFNAEVGYNLWWKDREKVTLRDEWVAATEDIGVYNAGAGGGSATANSTIASTVGSGNDPTNDTSFLRVDAARLNLASAAHKSALSHKVFAGLSIDGKLFDAPSMLGVGGSYEFADSNTALNKWAIWVKTSMSF